MPVIVWTSMDLSAETLGRLSATTQGLVVKGAGKGSVSAVIEELLELLPATPSG